MTRSAPRVLLLSTAFPDDPRTRVVGVHQRLRMFVDALAPIARLDALFFVDPCMDLSSPAVRRYRKILSEHWEVDLDLALCARETGSPSRWRAYGLGMVRPVSQPLFRPTSGAAQLAAVEAALGRSPDAVFVHRLPSMLPLLRTKRPLPPVYFDLDDVEHIAYRRDISQPPSWPSKRLRYLHLPALWWTERRAISLARRTFVCSERDRRRLRRTMRLPGIEVVPNAVEIHQPQPPPPTPVVLFLGTLNYPPNRAAATFLLRRIWPRVREAVPDAMLVIAGRHPELVEGYDERPAGVEFPGFAEDLTALYGKARVVCVPILAGGGTRIKVLEAASFGKPIVATRIGAEGLAFENERHLLVRDDPDAFAEAVIVLLSDRSRCTTLGLAAHEVVRSHYARTRVVDLLRGTFAAVFT